MEDMPDRQTVISHLARVPDEALDEILDFIDFVAARYGDRSRDNEFERHQYSSTHSVWNAAEDEVWNDVPYR